MGRLILPDRTLPDRARPARSTFIFMLLSPLGERLGEGVPKAVRNPLTQPLPLAGERRKNFQVGERRKIVLEGRG